MKYCIDQPGSLGDILFSIKIAEELAKKGKFIGTLLLASGRVV